MNAIPQAPVLTPDQLAHIDRVEGMVVRGRSCGTCSLCCKVVSIAEFDKPAGKWCQHCRPGAGCGIHAMRPFVCRGTYCEYMICKGLGEEWKPERSKFVLFKTNEGRNLTAHVDPGFPNAWRATPYYENFKIWAAEAAGQTPLHLVSIMVGEKLTVVLPDSEVEFGVMGPDELVQIDRDERGAVSVRKVRRNETASEPAA